MNRFIPGWALWAGLAACGVLGTAAVVKKRRAGKMRRVMRSAGKTLSQMSDAMLHIFS